MVLEDENDSAVDEMDDDSDEVFNQYFILPLTSHDFHSHSALTFYSFMFFYLRCARHFFLWI